jgi:hypothetical protein
MSIKCWLLNDTTRQPKYRTPPVWLYSLKCLICDNNFIQRRTESVISKQHTEKDAKKEKKKGGRGLIWSHIPFVCRTRRNPRDTSVRIQISEPRYKPPNFRTWNTGTVHGTATLAEEATEVEELHRYASLRGIHDAHGDVAIYTSTSYTTSHPWRP